MNKINYYLVVFFTFLAMSVHGQNMFTLNDIIARAQAQSPLAKQAETRKENRYWQYRFYKSNYNPQLRLSGNGPGIRNGNYRNNIGNFTTIDQIGSSMTLGLEQPLYFSGGNISINSNLDYLKDNGDNPFEQWSNSIVNIRIQQPLFSFNDLKWDRKTEPLRYEESRRSYVEEMEAVSSSAVNRFFAYLDGQINLQIAQYNLANNDTISKIEEGRYNIGTTSKDKLLQVKLQLLRSKQEVTQANLDLETAKLQLRSFVGFNEDVDFSFVLPEKILEFDISLEVALEHARQNRASFIEFERRRIEANREVVRAKSQRFSVNMDASYGLNKLDQNLEQSYQNPTELKVVDVRFSVPILDWGRNQARVKTALANKRLNDYIIAQDEVNFEQEIMTLVRKFEVLRSQVEITKESDNVAQERYMVAQNRYLIGKIDITNLNIALTEKDNAKRSYVNSLRLFWGAYYDLRRLTLYDFANNQLLYNPDLD
ncbi:MAG: TolC family protein [Cyclobacteriaceae bacterium]|nr:TolC family protein [Cyclobacteriaceae bacterium]